MRRLGLSAIELARLQTLTDVGAFKHKILETWHFLNAWCATQAFYIEIICGARTAGEHMKLYAQGREKLADAPPPWGAWKQVGPVVTKVLPTETAHCYGAGVDLAFLSDRTHQWVPDFVRNPDDTLGKLIVHPAWVRLASEADTRGLRSGYTLWGWDYGHVQLPAFLTLARQGKLRFLG